MSLRARGLRIHEREGDSVTEGMLQRYFRDMAVHAVMTPEQETLAARQFEEAELARWRAALAFPPALGIVLRVVQQAMLEAQCEGSLPEVEKLTRLEFAQPRA